ncbi:MAG: MraY family glycosyltransferase [Candidatus Firestonebacteria bacterium]
MIKKILYFFAAAGALYLLMPFSGTWFYQNNLRGIYVLLLAFLLAVVFTPFAIKVALKFNILDIPNDRKIHSTPIPRIGGLAIFLAFLITVGRNYHFPKEVIGLLSGLVLVFSAEFLDDIKSNSAFLRLGAQVTAVIMLIISGVYITIIPAFPGSIFLNYLLTVFWVVGIINAVNFLDGVDGLAAGLGIVSGLSFFAVIYFSGQQELSYLLLAFLGACLGFLFFNFKPAKIFLGDSGSSTIGFLLASFSIIGVWDQDNVIIGSAMPILIMGIPIFDMIYTTVSRIKNGSVATLKEWIEFTGKDHFHHRLMHIGFSQKATVVFLYVLNLVLGLSALALTHASEKEAILLLFQAVLIFGIIVVLMRVGRNVE